jgi:hypothetical protein
MRFESTLSDHRPIGGVFTVKVKKIDPDRELATFNRLNAARKSSEVTLIETVSAQIRPL